VEDLVAYLRVTFTCLAALPPATFAAVHFASAAYVHSNLRAALLDDGLTSSPSSRSSIASSSESGDGSGRRSRSPPLSPPLGNGGCLRVNALALHGLRLDVLCLETFADGCASASGAPPLSGLKQAFAPLRQLLDALLDRGASHVLGHLPTRRALHPQLDARDAVAVLQKVVGLPAMARIKLLSASSLKGGSAAASELPSLDKKQAAELIKLLLACGA
jgi:hypothetical protein